MGLSPCNYLVKLAYEVLSIVFHILVRACTVFEKTFCFFLIFEEVTAQIGRNNLFLQ